MRVRMSSVGHYPGIDGTLERTYPTAASAPGTRVMKMKMRMTKLTMKDKMLIILKGLFTIFFYFWSDLIF